jgi:uncharacterized protein (DUF1697 family)
MNDSKTYIALFRGINVGGNNILPMKQLRAGMEEIGFRNVESYIASGNVVFQSKKQDTSQLSETLGELVKENHGFKPNVLILKYTDLKKSIDENPYPEATEEPKTLHIWFLKELPDQPDISGLHTLKKSNERFHLGDQVFYLHAPDGIGKSKVAEKVEKLLGVPATARNWRTVSKIAEIVKRYEP